MEPLHHSWGHSLGFFSGFLSIVCQDPDPVHPFCRISCSRAWPWSRVFVLVCTHMLDATNCVCCFLFVAVVCLFVCLFCFLFSIVVVLCAVACCLLFAVCCLWFLCRVFLRTCCLLIVCCCLFVFCSCLLHCCLWFVVGCLLFDDHLQSVSFCRQRPTWQLSKRPALFFIYSTMPIFSGAQKYNIYKYICPSWGSLVSLLFEYLDATQLCLSCPCTHAGC